MQPWIDLLNGGRQVRWGIWTTGFHSPACTKGMRIGVGFIDRRPSVRAGTYVQFAVSVIGICRPVRHTVRTRRTGIVSSTLSRPARGWSVSQGSLSGSRCPSERRSIKINISIR